MLPVALGKATKSVQGLLTAGKEYITIMYVHQPVPEGKLRNVCGEFIGKIKQLPPLKSAIKRQWRERKIYYLDIMEVDEQFVLFRVGCEAGTYIRKLCLHPETEIISKDSLILAKDFFINPKIINSYDMNNKKIMQKSSSEKQKFNFNGKLVKITMDSGIDFMVTPDHKMLASSEDNYIMKPASQLKTSDYIAKSLNYPIPEINPVISDLLDDSYLVDQKDVKELIKKAFIKKYGSIRAMNRALKLDRKSFLENSEIAIPIGHIKKAGIYEEIKNKIQHFKTEKGMKAILPELNSDLLYLIGLVASDGNNTKEKGTRRFTRIKFHNKNKDLIEIFDKKYRKIFPNFNLTKTLRKDGIMQLDTTNSLLATMCANLGIKSPQKKSDILPILHLSKKLIASFLRGYFDGDGTAYYKIKSKVKGIYSRIDFFTVNATDAKRLHQMLLKLDITNKIFKKRILHVVSINDPAAKKRFISLIGSNHPFKREKLKMIKTIKSREINDNLYIGLHYKKYLDENKTKLKKLGGNLNRILSSGIPVTRGVYKTANKIVKLPSLDNLCIEKIKSIEFVNYSGSVYDMTVPDTHNFLIETGFVSSNCHDIGQKLGTGAHMAELRRTKVGPFDESTLFTLQDLTDAFWYWKNQGNEKYIKKVIQPPENAIRHLPKIWIMDTTVDSLCHGASLAVPGIAKLEAGIERDQRVAVMTLKDEIVCTGIATLGSNEIMKAEKGFAVRTERVFMEPGIYPKMQNI